MTFSATWTGRASRGCATTFFSSAFASLESQRLWQGTCELSASRIHSRVEAA
jgi:hypothetical protein